METLLRNKGALATVSPLPALSLDVRVMRSALAAPLLMLLLASCQTQENHDYSILKPPTRSFPSSAFRQSIHHSDFIIDPLVKNGDCYEQFQITLPESISTIILPPDASAHRRDGTFLVGHLKKSLSWAGHPETKMSIEDQRPQMGVAIKMTGRTLRITSFGAWHSLEGGSSVTLLVGVPEGVSILYAKDQRDNRTAGRLTQDGWFVVVCRPLLKKDYDCFMK